VLGRLFAGQLLERRFPGTGDADQHRQRHDQSVDARLDLPR
jgi:hypothetical protein